MMWCNWHHCQDSTDATFCPQWSFSVDAKGYLQVAQEAKQRNFDFRIDEDILQSMSDQNCVFCEDCEKHSDPLLSEGISFWWKQSQFYSLGKHIESCVRETNDVYWWEFNLQVRAIHLKGGAYGMWWFYIQHKRRYIITSSQNKTSLSHIHCYSLLFGLHNMRQCFYQYDSDHSIFPQTPKSVCGKDGSLHGLVSLVTWEVYSLVHARSCTFLTCILSQSLIYVASTVYNAQMLLSCTWKFLSW